MFSSCTSLIKPPNNYVQKLHLLYANSFELHHHLFVAFKRKTAAFGTLSFLADLLMAHIPTRSCASSGHDRIHP